MKKILIATLMLVGTISISAQTLVKGDMNDDGDVTISDITSVVATALGNIPQEVIDIDKISEDYSAIEGIWYSSDNGQYYFKADGTMPWDEILTFKYLPIKEGQAGVLVVYMMDGSVFDVKVVKELTADRLVWSQFGSNDNITLTRTFLLTGLSISPKRITADVGETQQIETTLTPANSTSQFVRWNTSNSNVATVDQSGLVTMVGPGSCNIYASTTDGTCLKDTCAIKVPLYIESLTLKENRILLSQNHSYNLTSTITPANADNTTLTWSSSDPDIASVSSDGKVTALNFGTTTITCTTQDGTNLAASCTVIVQSHEYVDLGLPSGTLWATTNIGALTEIEIGDNYRWGETTPKKEYSNDWNLYKYSNDNYNKLTKYCTVSTMGYEGFVDNKMELDAEDDAATVNWGEDWCMPTVEQWRELINNCQWDIALDYKGTEINGFLVTSKAEGNTNSIFIPASGKWSHLLLFRDFLSGYYWSRSLSSIQSPYAAYDFLFDENNPGMETKDRTYGRNIRPVRATVK